MSIKLEFKGKDVDEAISKACKKLHAPREELDIEIISTGSSGIFGLCKKQAVIRAGQKVPENERPAKKESKHPPKPEPAPEIEEHDEEEASEQKKITEQRPAPPKKKPARENRKRDKEPETPLEPLTPEILDQIKNDLAQMLTLMGFPSELTIEEKNNKAYAKISGEHIDELTGNDGQALDSIQYLMRKFISKKFPQKILFAIDAGEFREKRKIELQELALKLADEVKVTEKTKTIPALNPAERRIVHLALQEDKTIRSRSVGDGLFKKILIYLPGKGRARQASPRRKVRKN
ncbi:MAG: Jag N-terminal domain-containing protein [Pseudomonadota bacterium]